MIKNELAEGKKEVIVKEKTNQNWFDFGTITVASYQKEEIQPIIMDWTIL